MSGVTNQNVDVCSKCHGSGVITTRDGPEVALMNEAGVFCRSCSAGHDKWQATVAILAGHQAAVDSLSQSSGRPMLRRGETRVFVGR